MDPRSHILIVDDSDGLLHQSARSSLGSSSESSSGPTPGSSRIITLQHPKRSVDCKYLLSGRHLCELQRATQSAPCSWFVGQSVFSDGSLLIASRVDPAFMLLPILDANGQLFSPKAQLLSSAAVALRDLEGVDAALLALCDTTAAASSPDEEGGEEEGSHLDESPLLFRLNADKVTRFLMAKARRLGAVLQAQSDRNELRLRSLMGVFSSVSESVGSSSSGSLSSSTSTLSPSSSAAAKGPDDLDDSSTSGNSSGAAAMSSPSSSSSAAAISQTQMISAVGILGEYLSDKWTEVLVNACGIPLASVLPKLAKQRGIVSTTTAASSSSSSSAANDDDLPPGYDQDGAGATDATSSAARWNSAALEDPSSIVSKYVRPVSSGAGKSEDSAKKAGKPALTIQQKRLANTNTSGMKSMTSFFGKK